jgi:hypothetical protein
MLSSRSSELRSRKTAANACARAAQSGSTFKLHKLQLCMHHVYGGQKGPVWFPVYETWSSEKLAPSELSPAYTCTKIHYRQRRRLSAITDSLWAKALRQLKSELGAGNGAGLLKLGQVGRRLPSPTGAGGLAETVAAPDCVMVKHTS